MNRKFRVVVLLIACSAASSVFAADACSIELCMSGMILTGGEPDKCSGPIKDFFDIKKYKNGALSPSRTLKARKALLEKCPSKNVKEKSEIIAKYGAVFL